MSDRMSGLSVSLQQTMAALTLAGAAVIAPAALAADFHPITADAPGKLVTLTGHDLTIEDVVAVARHGAQVRYSPEAIQRAAEIGRASCRERVEISGVRAVVKNK